MEETVPHVQQTQSTPEPPKTRSRMILLIIALTLVVVSLLSIAFLGQNRKPQNPTPSIIPSPTPVDETANLKTYRNQKYGFTFNYDSSLHFKEVENSTQKNLYIALGPNTLAQDMIYSKPLLHVTADESNLGVDQVINTNYCDFGRCVSSKDAIELTVAGVPAKKVTNPPSPIPDWTEEIVIFRNGSTLFSIGIIYHTSAYGDIYSTEKKQELFDQILSTFKFLDISPTPTCIPRPACLDQEPRCLMPESENMCPPKTTPTASPNQVVCTQEAKLCPNGLYVGRTGPKCEFSPCPQ